MLMKIKLIFDNETIRAELYDTPSGKEIYSKLPYKASIHTWGNEIYFSIPVNVLLESEARSTLEVGELAFYPPISAFCIFYGPTPISSGDKPEASGDVNIFGKVMDEDLEKLKRIRGENVKVERL